MRSIISWIFLCGVASAKLPIVLWHGMGDTCCDTKGIGSIQIHLESQGYKVLSMRIGNDDDQDRKRGYLDNSNVQVDLACEQFADIPFLRDGFNAIGFSQGGLFLRAYVQRCNSPPIRNLISFGTPHGGVSDVPNCVGESSAYCSVAKSLIKIGVYLPYIQNRVVQAQYYRDPARLDEYREKSIFLADLNQEKTINGNYKTNFAKLDSFSMVLFDNDTIIIPKESAYFSMTDDENNIIPLKDSLLYRDDLLGLKYLDSKSKLNFHTLPNNHMQFSLDDIDYFTQLYFDGDMFVVQAVV